MLSSSQGQSTLACLCVYVSVCVSVNMIIRECFKTGSFEYDLVYLKISDQGQDQCMALDFSNLAQYKLSGTINN